MAAVDMEDDLIEDTILLLAEGKYPDGCTVNRKRQIRQRAKKFELRDNELYYIPGRNKPVC